jgi:SAM-dependent methyltransferase
MTSSLVSSPKLSHAALEPDGRRRKAARIEQLLTDAGVTLSTARMLDVGTGSGTIASYFRSRVTALNSVDVVDERTDTDFDFRLIESEVLPFEDAAFDVAISNHVVEHVDDPQLHLDEIGRVLRPGGVCYIATPNKLWPMEPHFDLPFLAWLPSPSLRDRYVRLTRRGQKYDAQLLTRAGLARSATKAGLSWHDLSLDMTSALLAAKTGKSLTFARPIWGPVSYITPSLVGLLRKASVPKAPEGG